MTGGDSANKQWASYGKISKMLVNFFFKKMKEKEQHGYD